jgi:hypothetical protein
MLIRIEAISGDLHRAGGDLLPSQAGPALIFPPNISAFRNIVLKRRPSTTGKLRIIVSITRT